MQKLIIKNLGPIKNCEMEVRPFTIFIGESGSGKSILLRTISMLKWVYKQVQYKRLLEHIGEIKSLGIIDIKFNRVIKDSKLDDYINDRTSIEFIIDDRLLITIKNKKIDIKNDKISSSPLLLSKIVFLDENRSILPEIKPINVIRDFSDLEGRSTLPLYTKEMLDNYDRADDEVGKNFYVKTTDIVLLHETNSFGSRENYIIKNGHKVKFKNASSGEKSSSIIELIGYYFSQEYSLSEIIHKIDYLLFRFTFLQNKNKNIYNIEKPSKLLKTVKKKKLLTLLIEEPESNLFPTNQRDLTYFLSSLRKMKNNPEVIFSTHSPYILTVVNNLLYADELVNKNSKLKEKVDAVIPEESQLSIDDLSAYVVENGTVESIIDKETNLINGEYIDKVSDELMSDFDKLYEMKWNK